MVTFRQIRNFLALSETLHFARAAEKLGIAPAVLSKEIIKMEKDLCFKLFDRSDKRNITLTDAGKAYWQRVKDLPETLENACLSGRKTAAGEQGTISVAISGVSCRFFDIETICQQISRRYPEVNFGLSEFCTPGQTLEQLKNGKCDLAIFPFVNDLSPAIDANFEYRIAGSYNLSCMVPSHHPLSKREEVTAYDLQQNPLILPSRDFAPGLRKFLDKYFLMEIGRLPQPAYEVDGLSISTRLTTAGLGISVFAGQPFSGELDKNKLLLRPLKADIRIKNLVVWRTDSKSVLLSNMVTLFLNSLRQEREYFC